MSFRTPAVFLVTGLFIGSLALPGCSASPQSNGADSTAAMAAAPSAAAAQPKLTDHAWQWIATRTPVESIAPADPRKYTIQFNEDGSTALLADCNRGSGTHTHTAEGGIKIAPVALTRRMCPPGSLDSRFLQQLGVASHTFFRDDTLYIDLGMDRGTMRFSHARGTAD